MPSRLIPFKGIFVSTMLHCPIYHPFGYVASVFLLTRQNKAEIVVGFVAAAVVAAAVVAAAAATNIYCLHFLPIYCHYGYVKLNSLKPHLP